MKTLDKWLELIGAPHGFNFDHSLKLIKKYDCEDFDAELYLQSNGMLPNGEITFQRLLMAFPKNMKQKLPAVAVPFYYPEAALGFDPETAMPQPGFDDNPTMLDITRRGYITASADSYHLNYIDSYLDRNDFRRWSIAAAALNSDHPEWSGIGKLVADTKLILDALEADPRVDSSRIGIAGHSLGGKIAFYTGCADDRVRVILASDFGMGWGQSNWGDPWYWGKKLEAVKDCGLDNASLLGCAAPKPFCLLAGEYDNDESRRMMYSVPEYRDCRSRLLIIDHAAGHRPPKYASDAGYGFLDFWLTADRKNILER